MSYRAFGDANDGNNWRFSQGQQCKYYSPTYGCFIGVPRCGGSYETDAKEGASCEEGSCPILTYNNKTWKAQAGNRFPWIFWNERRICKALQKWVVPSFGYRTSFDAYMAWFKVPPLASGLSGRRLAGALANFEALYPPACKYRPAPTKMWPRLGYTDEYGMYNVWTKERAIMWALSSREPGGKERDKPISWSSWPDKLYDGNLRVDGWVVPRRGPAKQFISWLEDPDLRQAFLQARARLGLQDENAFKAWTVNAGAVIDSVPGSEPEKSVQEVVELIRFSPGRVEIHPWVERFVQTFYKAQREGIAEVLDIVKVAKPVLPKFQTPKATAQQAVVTQPVARMLPAAVRAGFLPIGQKK